MFVNDGKNESNFCENCKNYLEMPYGKRCEGCDNGSLFVPKPKGIKSLPEIRKSAFEELESVLWKLGSGEDSVFPYFELTDLNYGIQRESDNELILETKFKRRKDNEPLFIKITIEIMP